MPLDFVPRERQRFTGNRPGSLRDAWNKALEGAGRPTGQRLSGFGVFDTGQMLKVDQGRVEVNANDLLSEAIKQPAYALEAPLRPFNVATGGGVQTALESVWQGASNVPILGAPLKAIEGIGGVLEASNKVGRAYLNYTLAQHLANVAGKPDSFMSNVLGENLSAGEIRKRVLARWSTNPFTGEQMSLAALEARAKKDPWNFGEFDVSENGILNFATTTLADPSTIGMLGAGAAVGLTGRAIRAASWARPAVTFGSRLAGAPRIGVGALKALGRATEQTRFGARFVDEYTSARQILNGQFAAHATLSGSLRATSWLMRGLYMPGRAAAIERGMSPVGATVMGYTRGGLQQNIGLNAAEQVTGVVNGWLGDNELDSPNNGFTSWLQDTLHTINNDHPLSDKDSFVVVALFSPWASALGDINRSVRAGRIEGRLPRYTNDTLFHVKDEFRRSFGRRWREDEIFTSIGKGDAAQGRAAWEWFTDQAEVLKAGNQLSNFTRNVAEVEDIAARQQYLTSTVVDKIKVLREKGALQANSLADYMMDMYKNGPTSVGGDTLASQFEIRAEGFWNFVGDMYRAHEQLAPEFAKMGNLQLMQGAPITREIIEGIDNILAGLPEGELVPRDVAAQIMEAGPSLVWEDNFWMRFSSTLGQRQASGRFGRANTVAEGVTVRDLRQRLSVLSQSAPPASELYHEAVAASRKAVRIRPGETMVSEPPYKMPKRLADRRTYNTGLVRNLAEADRTITAMRDAEFFKSGKPRLASAKDMAGHDGGHFVRSADNEMRRESDGLRFSVHDGLLTMTKADSEALVLGVRNGGRTAVRPVSDGPLMAEHGFVEVARIKGTDLATYAYRGGDVSQIIANRDAGAFSAYRPSKREVASTNAGLNLARRSANEASLTRPSMDAIGPSPTKAGRHLNPEERLKELNGLREAIRAQRRFLVKQISEADDLAMQLSGIDTNVATLGDWFNSASKGSIEATIKLIKDVNRDYPNLGIREGQGLFVDPRMDRFSQLINTDSVLRRLVFDYGELSPINFLYQGLLAPVNARWLGKQTQSEIHNLLAQSGFTASESRQFVAALRDEVMKSRSVPGSLGEMSGSHLFRSVRGVPEPFVRAALESAAPTKAAEVVERWGGVQKMLTEAGNRLLRNSAKRARSGGKVDPLLGALNNAFRFWQYGPVTRTLSDATHLGTKTLYPLFRFNLDPLFHIMNRIEPDMYGVSMEGLRASRRSPGIVGREQSANAAEQASLTSIPPGGLRSAETPVDLLLADPGAYTMPRNIRPVLEKHFDVKRIESTSEALNAIKKEDPIAVMLTEQFGDDVKDWAKALDEMMYGYVTKGPEATVRAEARNILETQMGFSKDELKAMTPIIERLASIHRGQYNDLVQLYVGRMNRPNIERILDHYFLFWPLSYQIKAATWMAGIMFKKIGGIPTGAAGAYMYREYRNRWNQTVANDPSLEEWTAQNDGFMFMFDMMFPLTPQGVGVSLSRPTRYATSWLAKEWEMPEEIQTALGEYENVNTIPDAMWESAKVGPVRSLNLFSQILRQFEVPGFTYEPESEGSAITSLPSR